MTSTLDELTVSSVRGIMLVNNLEYKKLAQLSQRILSSMPVKDIHSLFTEEEKEMLISALTMESSADLTLVVISWIYDKEKEDLTKFFSTNLEFQ